MEKKGAKKGPRVPEKGLSPERGRELASNFFVEIWAKLHLSNGSAVASFTANKDD